MTIESLQALIDANNVDKIKSTFENIKIIYTIGASINQYYIKNHDVINPYKRQDKQINDEDGRPTDIVKVARLPLPIQKNIVMVAAAFLGVPEISCNPANENQKNFVKIIQKVLEDNKFDYKFNSIVKKTKSEKQSAILIYNQELESGSDYWTGFPIDKNTKYKLRFKILAPSNGDMLYPVFDSFGDMIAFGRYYESTDIVNGAEVKNLFFDIYTPDKFYFYKKEGNGQWESNKYPNLVGKIPVIYFWQPLTDWEDVQPLISRLEVKTSNHADTNDYYDSPIVKAKGDVKGFSNKGESGKVLQMSEGADAEYMTYDSLPESMKMEMNNLIKFINTFTHTPDISFENLKGLGYFSTVALKVMFMDAHLKAYDSEEIFGEGAQRLYNYLKQDISIIAPEFKPATVIQLKPKFTYFLPQNISEEVDMLLSAYKGGMISLKSMLEQSPLIEDADNEMKQIEKEKPDASPTIEPPLNPLNPIKPPILPVNN